MLNQFAFAHSLAVLTATLYVLFGLLALVSPRAFQLLFNAQFFGADVAALLPKVTPSAVSLVTFVIVVGMSWVIGYVWAWQRLPYPDSSFDGAYTQHVTMNVADRPAFFAEAYRVLKPGCAFYLLRPPRQR